MSPIKVYELNDVDEILIRCIREWVKAVFYAQNPMPALKYLLSKHKIQKTMIPIDDLMSSIVLSRRKKLDFKVSNCCFLGQTEKEILAIMYNIQIKNEKIATNLISDIVEKVYLNIANSSAKLICKDFTEVGLFFNDPSKHPAISRKVNKIINYDFRNKKII